MDLRVLRTAHPFASLIVRLMSRRGLVRIPRWGIVVSGAVPMREVMMNPRLFIKNGRHGTAELFTRVFGAGMLMNTEGDGHRLLRRAIAPRFTAAQSRELCATFTQEIVDDTRERLLRGERVDFVQVAQLATGIATVRLAGWKLEGAELHARARYVYAKSIELSASMSALTWKAKDADIENAQRIVEEMTADIHVSYDAQDPETVPGLLALAGVPFEQARGVIGTLLVAGIDTTASALTRMVALLCDSDELARLRADPTLVGSAVDESLRHVAAVPVVTRTTTEATHLHGHDLPADSAVLVLIMNCLKDEVVLENARDFRANREMSREVRKLWFGSGQHFCPGQFVARELMSNFATMFAELDRPIRIVRRQAARKVLMPNYARLEVELVR
ncbi:MAG: cytochrome [Thermoleophilia bacterium]|nr:cytochrome [Thermoleophilia bacterium]